MRGLLPIHGEHLVVIIQTTLWREVALSVQVKRCCLCNVVQKLCLQYTARARVSITRWALWTAVGQRGPLGSPWQAAIDPFGMSAGSFRALALVTHTDQGFVIPSHLPTETTDSPARVHKGSGPWRRSQTVGTPAPCPRSPSHTRQADS